MLTVFRGVGAARRSLAVTSFIVPESRTWLGTFSVVFSEESLPSTARFVGRQFRCRQFPLSSMSEKYLPVTRPSFTDFARRHPTQHRRQHSAIVTAVVEDIAKHGLLGCITPPGWRPFVREYRRRVLIDPVLSGVPTACEHGVLYLFPAQAAALME